jgi:vitamin B12 transporter
VLYVGKRADRDFSVFPAGAVALPGYFLVNGALAAPLGRVLFLTLRLDNVLNTRYETVWGYGSPGFAVNVGFRLAL